MHVSNNGVVIGGNQSYPYIGKADFCETLVMFIGRNCGEVLQDKTGCYDVGEYSENWVEDEFFAVCVKSEFH